jgi:hypothetical protein
MCFKKSEELLEIVANPQHCAARGEAFAKASKAVLPGGRFVAKITASQEEGDDGNKETPEMSALKQQVQVVMQAAEQKIAALSQELEASKSGDRYKEIELQLAAEKLALDRYKAELDAAMQQERMAHESRMKLALTVNQNKHDIDMVEAKAEADIATAFAKAGASGSVDVEVATTPDDGLQDAI